MGAQAGNLARNLQQPVHPPCGCHPQARRPPEARVKLQHAQRLEVQRELQRAREVRLEGGGGAAANSWGSDAGAEAVGTGEDQQAGSPRYDPGAVARWMAHFGV